MLTEPVHLAQESTNNFFSVEPLSQGVILKYFPSPLLPYFLHRLVCLAKWIWTLLFCAMFKTFPCFHAIHIRMTPLRKAHRLNAPGGPNSWWASSSAGPAFHSLQAASSICFLKSFAPGEPQLSAAVFWEGAICALLPEPHRLAPRDPPAYVSIRQHTSGMRQHMSADVSIRRHLVLLLEIHLDTHI